MRQLINNWQQVYREIESKSISKSMQYTLLTLILFSILMIRLATINTPSLKWTFWKEVDYIYISQNYMMQGFRFFLPEVAWPADPPRVTEMELPLVPFITGLLYKFLGFNVYTARAITLFAFLLLILFVFKLVKRELGPFTGLIAAFIAGVMPLYHPFGKYLFTEPTMIALSVMSLYYMAEWVNHERRRDWILALAIFSLTVSLKVESLYLFLPIAWIAIRKYRWEVKRYRSLMVLIMLALILPVLWYSYAYYLENTGAHLFGIFKGHNKSQTLSMLSDFRWYETMAKRVVYDILGGRYGTLFFLFGLVLATRSRKMELFFAYMVAVGVYFALVAEGNIDAPYRQLPLIPSMAVFVALGIQGIVITGVSVYRTMKGDYVLSKNFQRIVLIICLVIVVLIPMRGYKRIFFSDGPMHPDRWRIAQEINKYKNEQSKLIVIGEYSKHVGGYDLSPVLYYYTNLQGWTLKPVDWNLDKIEELRKRGATLFIALPPYNDPSSVNYQLEQSADSLILELKTLYPVLYENQEQLILDLR